MGTQQLTSTFSSCELSHESDLCPDEILSLLRTLDDNSNSSVFNVVAADILPLKKDKNRTSKENQKRKRPTKSTTSSSPGLCYDEESDEGLAVLSKRKIIKRQKGSISPETSMEDESGEEVGVGRINNNGKVVSHIAVERNRRKLMNAHLAVLRQLMPSFHVKKGDQASIVGGVINYINELHHVLQSLEAKKRRKMYTSEMCQSPRVASSPRFSSPRQHLNPSPLSSRKPNLSPRLVTYFPVTPRTPQSTSSYYKPPGQSMILPPSYIRPSPTINTNSFGYSIGNKNLMMNAHTHNNSGVDNELAASLKSDFVDVGVKFCGANLQLKTISSKRAGQTVKVASAIEDLSLEILQLSIHTIEETMVNAFTVKIGIDCQLSAEELAQKIQNTFC